MKCIDRIDESLECIDHALDILGRWGRIEKFLEDNAPDPKLVSQARQRVYARTIGGSDAMVICLVLVKKYLSDHGKGYTLGKLAAFLENPKDYNRITAAKDAIKDRFVPALECYGLINVRKYEGIGGRWDISATDRLAELVCGLYEAASLNRRSA